ncbi:MAG: hypothetical protein ACREHG_07865 [Candidatus Saccharimonadales bacterium]
MQDITVYTGDGGVHPVTLPQSRDGTEFPLAVLDTGVPLILTTSNIANAIYGALGVGPSQDGNCESQIHQYFFTAH